ncbi:branched-chain amino acid ABC transporter permease [Treponema phagedenis]|uniref:Branched-chain amino acid ABC transporter permease n=1 Tax=Treponema phagedenis TaxID=162 RepID=A0A0B7GZ40_TREPH|nr:branched-chain amino acid ABC transporter permease [Treponema phagedenis]NVP23324.1 branched-chain amino acid ABC transporter permease [Treponema phagedenis]QEJ95539.1 branched-chain amino acid ABC transporter permease [Treponema phagedenis]QEJ98433.1 branched-chain amino acid ABC transporter permease [Treponema phagedenis]QEK01394.1 branched-chain amino acid ABC transporter permease [Treponema phagedenis]QEK03941.1 branched-chain amino acid ABC transporter permease [Treponema phagedenis]
MVIQQLINGLSLGSIYALIALGYTMVYGIVLLINFAHGDVLMLGAYVGYYVLLTFGTSPLSFVIAIGTAMVVCAAVGIIIERFAYRPLRNAPRLNSLITAIAVSLILQNGARVLPFIGPDPRQFPTLPTVKISVGDFDISNIQLIVVSVSIGLMFLLNYIVNHTKAGKAMRAVSFDATAAGLMGVSINGIISFTFALGSALAAAGGVLFALAYPQIEPTMGAMPGLKAFIAAVLGGIGSIPGAMIGGYILGLVETLTKGFLSSQYADAISFSLLIIILLVKPSGLMGKKTRVKV